VARYTTINACDSLTSWSLDTNGVGTGSLDTSIKEEGAASIKYVRTISKSRNFDCTLRYSMGSARDITDKVLVFKYRWDTPQNKLTVRFVNSGGTSIGTLSVSENVAPNVWHTARVPYHGVALLQINRIDILTPGDTYASWADGQTVTLWLDDIKTEGPGRRIIGSERFIVMEYDDGFEDTNTEAFPLMQQYGHVGVLGMITDVIGGNYPSTSTPMLSEAQIAELAADGWEIASHSKSHVNMKTASTSGIHTQMSESKEDLEALGYAVTHFIYPFTQHDEESIEISQQYYDSTSNGTPPKQNLKRGQAYTILSEDNPFTETNLYCLMRQACSSGVTAGDVKMWVKDSLRYGTLLILNFHEINDAMEGPSGASWSPARLEDLLRYLNAESITTKTITQALRYLGYLDG
jgi:peptidoglycan/xylan/chitin deacetylase (PgdA/CDA1 family)